MHGRSFKGAGRGKRRTAADTGDHIVIDLLERVGPGQPYDRIDEHEALPGQKPRAPMSHDPLRAVSAS
jgi:hypothetical protein